MIIMIPIDFDELNEITGGNNEIITECFKKFLEILPAKISDINDSIINIDYKKLNYTAHSLKNSLNFLAARQAGKLAFKLEKMSEDKIFINIELIFDNLKDECNKLSCFIKKYLSKKIGV